MKPEEKTELARLRQSMGSFEDMQRLDELEQKEAAEGGVRSRLRAIVVRAADFLGRRVAPVIAPSAHWRRPESEEASEETPLDQALRIHGEYLQGLDRFTKQRAEWKEMFRESWPHHLVAQQLMEKTLEAGRTQIVDLATIAARELGAKVAIAARYAPGAAPVGLAAEYEATMKAIEATTVDTDVAAERQRILDACPVAGATAEAIEDVLAENKSLFRLIATIERERDAWKECSLSEQGQHNAAQSRLQTAIAAAAEIHGQLLAAVNAKRTADNGEVLRTREDLKRAAAAIDGV